MSDTIQTLRKKADRLWRRLRDHGIHVKRNRKHDVLAISLGEIDWCKLLESYHKLPRPYTDYRPRADLLAHELSISVEIAQSVINELHWPSSYIPSFNTFPLSENGEVKLSFLFFHSHLFSYSRKREKGLLQKRIAIFDYDCNMSKDFILYSGDQLNFYDKQILIALFVSHPKNKAIGHEFDLYQNKIEQLYQRHFSKQSLNNSLLRMRDCRINIPSLNFFGPLIHNFREIKQRGVKNYRYRISLNPELIKFYRDNLYGDFMDTANLFHHRGTYEKKDKKFNYRAEEERLSYLEKKDYIQYSEALNDDWPTKDKDIAAIWSIIAKEAHDGKVSFKIFDDVIFNDDTEEIGIKFPNWWMESMQYFKDFYGEKIGLFIFQKAISYFMSPLFDKGQ